MKAAGLITVAGQSLRMGAFKPLLPIDGKPMIARTADVFLRAGIPDLFVVVGKRGDEVAAALSGYRARILTNEDYAQTEMFASVRIGLAAIRDEGGFGGAFLLPGDMPAVPSGILRSLLAELASGDWDAVFPSNGSRRLHPPLIRSGCFERLIAYTGGDGLRGAFREANLKIGYVVTAEEGCLLDVDTPEDLERAKSQFSARNEGKSRQ